MSNENDTRSLVELVVSGELAFDEVGSEAAEILESAVDQLFPMRDTSEIIQEIRTFADEKGIPLTDAILVKAAVEPGRVGSLVDDILARDAFQAYGVDLTAPVPEELRGVIHEDLDFEGRFDDPRFYRAQLVSELDGMSLSASAVDSIERLADMKMEQDTVWEDYQNEIEKFDETGKGRVAEALSIYNELCSEHKPVMEAIYENSRLVISATDKRLGIEGLNPSEQSLARAVIADIGQMGVDTRDPQNIERVQLLNPNSILLAVDKDKAALEDACEAYRIEPTQEKLDAAIDRYYEYNETLEQIRTLPDRDYSIEEYTILHSSQETKVEGEFDDRKDSTKEKEEIDTFNMPQTLYAGHAGWHINSEIRQAELAKDDIAKKPWFLSEDVDGNLRKESVTMPSSAREDAHAVMDYAVSQSIWKHAYDYPTFGDGGIELDSSISRALDSVENGANNELPLSTELYGIINELEELGPRNGDKEHDAKIDELEAKQHDCYLRAGAVIAGANDTPDWREQVDAVLEYHRAEKITDDHSSDPRMLTSQDLGFIRMDLEKFNDEGDKGSPSRSGPAIEYCKALEIREKADDELPGLWEKFNEVYNGGQYHDLTELHRVDGAVYEAQWASQNSQRVMDRMATELELCKEGVEAYGIIHTEEDAIDKGEILEGGVEPEYVTREEIQEEVEKEDSKPKSPYEEAKESYDAIKDKYTFRNVFVSYDRLKLDIEAYKTGVDGAHGKPVSGGVIAMDVLELSRGSLWNSLVEVAIRSYFDEKYPATKDNDPVDTKDKNAGGVMVHLEPMDSQVDFSLRHFDNGYIDPRSRNETRSDMNKNPCFGKFMGADLTRPTEVRDAGIEVRSCGPRTGSTVTYQKENGDMETLRVPPIRLVEIKGEMRFYLVDPFGRTVDGNVSSSAKDKDVIAAIEHPYFKTLDISVTKFGATAIEEYAKSKGISVEVAKEQITHDAMEHYVDRAIRDVAKHEPYIRDMLLPESMRQLDAVSERLDYLKEVRSFIADHIENPKGYEDKQRKDAYDQFLGRVDSSIETLTKLENGLDDRVGKLTQTLEWYKGGIEQINVSKSGAGYKTDPETRFGIAVAMETRAAGKIDNPYYSVSKMDLQGLDKLCDACEFNGRTADTTLTHEFAGRDWPKESELAVTKDGAKVTFFEDRVEPYRQGQSIEWRDMLKDLVPHLEQRYPGLYHQEDVNKFEITDSGFKIPEILHDLGMLKTTEEERMELADQKRMEAIESEDDTAEARWFNMERHLAPEGGADSDARRTADMRIYDDRERDDIPSRKDIEATRMEIRDNGEISRGSGGFGCREKTPDLDWKTVSGDEILRDSDGKHFWMRIDGHGDDFIRVTPQQASGVLKGPMNSSDVGIAMDKYLTLESRPDSTYSFATDFFEDNKYRLTPESVLNAFSFRLEGFLLNANAGRDITKKNVDVVADSLVSMKETIVDYFADKIVDKMETIVEKCVSQGTDLERVTAFVDAVESRMQPLVNAIESQGFDKEDYKSTVDISNSLERINASGIGEGDASRLMNVIDVLGRAFEGFPDLMKSIAVTMERDAVDRVEREDDAAVVAEESDDTVDKPMEDEREPGLVALEEEMHQLQDELDPDDPPGYYSTEPPEDEWWTDDEEDNIDDEDDDDYSALIELSDGVVELFGDALDSVDAVMATLYDIDVYDGDSNADQHEADVEAHGSEDGVDAANATNADFVDSTAVDTEKPEGLFDTRDTFYKVDEVDVEQPASDAAVEITAPDQVYMAEDSDFEHVDEKMEYADTNNYNDDAADDGQADVSYDDSFDDLGQDEYDQDTQDDVQDMEQDDWNDFDDESDDVGGD